MIYKTIYIRNDWRVDVFIYEGDSDYSDFGDVNICLDEMDAPDHIIERCNAIVLEGKPNRAFTYSNGKRTCIYIGWTTSGAEFINSLVHELRHLIDHIADYYGIGNGEAVGYMSGDAAFMLAEEICELGCSHCRKEER